MNSSFDTPLLFNQPEETLQKSMVHLGGDATVDSDGVLIPSSPNCGGEGGSAATKWMPNEHSDQCVLCEKVFNAILRRKHHCRSCGALVCSKCSPDKHYVHGYKDQRVRVCLRCAEIREKR